MPELEPLREQICDIGRRLVDGGLVVAQQGNISVRAGAGEFLCTPTALCKGRLQPADLCLIDAAGNVLDGQRNRSSEVLLHLEIYRQCPHARAIVHSHPPHALAYAMTHQPLPRSVLPEVELLLGEVPLVPYATPGTADLSQSVIPYLQHSHTLLLANHGVVSHGAELEQALYRTVILDHYCRVLLLARSLGPVQTLTAEQQAELESVRRRGAGLK